MSRDRTAHTRRAVTLVLMLGVAAGRAGAQTPPLAVPPSPAPSASAPSTRGLLLERSRVGVVPGTTVTVGVGGGSGTVVARTSDASVDVRYDPVARKLLLIGQTSGTATVTVSDDSGSVATLAVLVAPPAGVVPNDVSVELGGYISPQFAVAQIQAAIAASAQLRAGTRAVVSDVTPGDTLRPGQTLEALARVHLDGASAYVDTDGRTSVHLKVDTLAQLDPQLLFYSDDPERLGADDDGVLYRGTLDPATPVRTYLYHVADDSTTHKLFLVLSATAGNAHVQLLGAAAGPSSAFAYVGHVSTLGYLLARGSQQSSVVTVSADRPYVQQVGNGGLDPGQLVAGIFDARVVDGGPVELAIVATSGDGDPLDEAAEPELAGDGHGRRGEFDLTTVAPLALTYAVGAPEPEPFPVGAPKIANLRNGGRPLGGDYGALRDVTLNLSNPSAAPATVYFYESPAGGSATTTIWFTGDPHPTEIPCVIAPNRYTVKAIDLAPGQTRAVTGEYMTDGASSFPLLFGLTSSPSSPPPGPAAPDACNPRPAAATPSAEPATPAAAASASPSAVPLVAPTPAE